MKITTSTKFGVKTTRIYPFCADYVMPRPTEGYIEIIYVEYVRIDLNIVTSPLTVERAAQLAAALTAAVRIAREEEKTHE